MNRIRWSGFWNIPKLWFLPIATKVCACFLGTFCTMLRKWRCHGDACFTWCGFTFFFFTKKYISFRSCFFFTVVLFYWNTPFTSSLLFVYLSVFSHHLCSHFPLSAATGSVSVFVLLIKLEAIIAWVLIELNTHVDSSLLFYWWRNSIICLLSGSEVACVDRLFWPLLSLTHLSVASLRTIVFLVF